MRKVRYQALGPLLSGEGSRAFLGLEITEDNKARPIVLIWAPEATSTDPELTSRLARETARAAKLQHPNIIRVFGLAQVDEGIARVVEFADGESLRKVLDVAGTLPPEFAAFVAAEAAAGVHFAHLTGNVDGTPLVHGDLRPETVMVSFSGVCKVAGYGALSVAPKEMGGNRVKGRRVHCAPEQVLGGRETATKETDVYLLGLILYECLTGMVPFGEEADFDQAVVSQPLRLLNFDAIPIKLVDVIGRATAKRAQDRFPTALAFREALEHAMGGLPTAEEFAHYLTQFFPPNDEARAARRREIDAGIADHMRKAWEQERDLAAQAGRPAPPPMTNRPALGEGWTTPSRVAMGALDPLGSRINLDAMTPNQLRPQQPLGSGATPPPPPLGAGAPTPPPPVTAGAPTSPSPLGAGSPSPSRVALGAQPPPPSRTSHPAGPPTPSRAALGAQPPPPSRSALGAMASGGSRTELPAMQPSPGSVPTPSAHLRSPVPMSTAVLPTAPAKKRSVAVPLLVTVCLLVAAGGVAWGVLQQRQATHAASPAPAAPVPVATSRPAPSAAQSAAQSSTPPPEPLTQHDEPEQAAAQPAAEAPQRQVIIAPQPAPPVDTRPVVRLPPKPPPAPPEPPGLDITTSPPLEVVVDGQTAGRAPLLVELTPGKHQLTLSDAAKGIRVVKTVTVPQHGKLKQSFSVGKGKVTISAPAGSMVLLDGKAIGRAPVPDFDAWEGAHKIAVTMGKAKWQQPFTLHNGETMTFNVQTTPPGE